MMYNPSQDELFYRRRLPHLYRQNHPLFLTWRLKFTLPDFILHHLIVMQQEFDRKTAGLSDEYRSMQSSVYQKQIFGYLDEQLGTAPNLPDLLSNPEHAGIVTGAIHFYNQQKYSLHAFCIMPNHVHLLITPYANATDFEKTISSVTQSLKRYTAREINKLLAQEGSLWASETYDHLVRSDAEFSRIVAYILRNPVKANLVNHWQDWHHSWVADDLQSIMES